MTLVEEEWHLVSSYTAPYDLILPIATLWREIRNNCGAHINTHYGPFLSLPRVQLEDWGECKQIWLPSDATVLGDIMDATGTSPDLETNLMWHVFPVKKTR